MNDFAKLRNTMVDNQLRPADITSSTVLDRFLEVPREEFVPVGKQTLAYADCDLLIAETEDGHARYLSNPAPFAKMVEAAALRVTDVVLDIASGTGYSVAILAGLCESVVALESDRVLVDAMNTKFVDLDISNAAAVNGPLNQGCAKEGPYDVIFINGAVDEVPKFLFSQLKDGGRVLAIVGNGLSGKLYKFTVTSSGVSKKVVMNAFGPMLMEFQKEESFHF